MFKTLKDKLAKWIGSIIEEKLKLYKYQTFQISTIKVNAGDRIVIKTKIALSEEAWKRIKEEIEIIFPGVVAVVLEEDMDFFVVNRDDYDWNTFFASAKEYIKTGNLPPADS